jgi:hypothetical protein
VLWSTPDAPMAGVPEKQTLERLCCAALRCYEARLMTAPG